MAMGAGEPHKAGEPQPKVSVVVTDDHPSMREGIRSVLGSDSYQVVAEAGDLAETLDTVARQRPGVLILDLNLAGHSALGSIPALTASSPETMIVVLTQEAAPALAAEALRGGARGYLLKSSPRDLLKVALAAALGGESWVDPALGAGVLTTEGAGRLTPRERTIVVRIAQGLTNEAIAADMNLSVRTVEGQRGRIRSALGLSTRSELTQWARDHGLLG